MRGGLYGLQAALRDSIPRRSIDGRTTLDSRWLYGQGAGGIELTDKSGVIPMATGPVRHLPAVSRKLVQGMGRLSRHESKPTRAGGEEAVVDDLVRAVLAFRVFELRLRLLERSLYQRTVGSTVQKAQRSYTRAIRREVALGETAARALSRLRSEVRRQCLEQGVPVSSREINRVLGVGSPSSAGKASPPDSGPRVPKMGIAP